MGDISAAGRTWLRDAVAPGSSTPHEPDKAEGRALMDLIDLRVSGLTAASIANGDAYETVTDLYAASGDHGHGDTAFVWGDPNPSFRDVWVRLIDPGVPYDGWAQTFIRSGVQVDADGFAVTDGVLLEGVQPALTRDAYPFLHWLSGPNGLAAWGAQPDGRMSLRLAARGLEWAADDAALGGLPRGVYPVANVRRGRRVTYATATALGRIFDVAQRNDGLFDTAIVTGGARGTGRAPLEIIAVYGQSNAGLGPQPALITTRLFPHHVVGLDAFDAGYGTLLAPIGSETDLIPVVDSPNFGNLPGHMMGWACAGRDLTDGVISPGYATFTSWEGGEPLASFTEGAAGHYNWANLMAGLAVTAGMGRAYGRDVACTSLVYIQGENATGFTKAALGDLIDDLITTIPTHTTQSEPPHVYLFQVNNSDTATSASGAELVQLELAVERLGDGVTLIGPMYQCPLFEEAGEDIHGSEPGRMVLADTFAVVKAVVDDGEDFSPLRPVTATRAAAVVDVSFDVPAGDLAFDTDWVAAAPNYGFRAYAVSGGAELTITSVVVLDADTVRITLSANPGGKVRIDYALASDSTDDGWASGRGQLISPTGVPSIFHALDFAVPEFVNHYCVRFSMETAS